VRFALTAAVLLGATSGGGAAAADDALCDGSPRGKLEMTGDIGDYQTGVLDDPVHDPTLFADGGTFYVFSTGRLDALDPGGIYARRSTCSLAGPWESLGSIPLPEWTRDYDVEHLWAPHVVEIDGTFHLYYAASSFGTNRSAIGLATTTTPGDLDSWVDQGPILTSQLGDDFNAIDPQVFSDGQAWYLVYGSFWTGIKMQPLADDMRTPGQPRMSLASNPPDPPNAIENAQVFRHGDHWYLAVSWGFCCRGVASTYEIAVGRSATPTGPFVDADGDPMTAGGGTILLDRRGNQIGPGALDVLEHEGRLYAVHHYYDSDTGGTIRMQIRELEWHDGWPHFSDGDGES
jgi:arabinan endo-1,5-alpha-L-arabinosidase